VQNDKTVVVWQGQSSRSPQYAGCMQSTYTRSAECQWVLWRRRGVAQGLKCGRRQTAFMPAKCLLTKEKCTNNILKLLLSLCYYSVTQINFTNLIE